VLTLLLSLALGDICRPTVTDDLSGTRTGVLTDGGLLYLADSGTLPVDAGSSNPEWRLGLYESKPLDVRQFTSSDTLTWRALRPSGLPLPDDGGIDFFALDSIDMRDNVLLLHFEDPPFTGAPAEVHDSSGLGHHGETDGGASLAPGLLGNGASFDGDACLTVNDAPNLRATNALTVSAWFYPRRVDGSAQGIVSSRFDYTDRSAWTLYLHTNGHLWVDLDMENDRHEGTIVITQDRWHHAAIVYDGALPSAVRARLFVDGVLDSTFPETSSSIPAYGAPITVGCLPNPMAGIKQGFAGELDEVAVSLRAYSLEEVAALYRRGASRVFGRARGCSDATCSTNPPWPGAFFSRGGGEISLTDPFVQVQLALVGDGSGQSWPEVDGITVHGPARSCDAGVDGGTDGGPSIVSDGGVDGPRSLLVGCGCDGVPFAPLLLVLLAWSRRRSAQ
jgi:uncharacterized protein (TIGR03382 family)